MRKIILFVFVLCACDQKPNPRVEWPPMDPSWGYSPDGGDAGDAR